jgi:hypothetical protein
VAGPDVGAPDQPAVAHDRASGRGPGRRAHRPPAIPARTHPSCRVGRVRRRRVFSRAPRPWRLRVPDPDRRASPARSRFTGYAPALDRGRRHPGDGSDTLAARAVAPSPPPSRGCADSPPQSMARVDDRRTRRVRAPRRGGAVSGHCRRRRRGRCGRAFAPRRDAGNRRRWRAAGDQALDHAARLYQPLADLCRSATAENNARPGARP